MIADDDSYGGGSEQGAKTRRVFVWAGEFGVSVRPLVQRWSRTATAGLTLAVADHYRRHAAEFDIVQAEHMLPGLVRDPLVIVQGKKRTTLVFVASFDQDRYLVVPIKFLDSEAWIETLYVTSKQRFHRRRWVRDGMLYYRVEEG